MKSNDFVAFLLIGVLVWSWFSQSVNLSCSAILVSGSIIGRVSVSKLLFPLVIVATTTFKFGFILLVLLLMLWGLGYSPSPAWLWLFLLLFVQLVLIIAASFWVSLLTPLIPDLEIVFHTLITALMFASGIFYSIDVVPADFRDLFYLNPIAALIADYRIILLDHMSPDLLRLTAIAVISALAALLAVLFERRASNFYARLVIRP